MTVGQRIKAARKRKHMTQDDLAKAFSPPISRAAVTLWETGANEPHLSKYEDLCRALDVSLGYLWGKEDLTGQTVTSKLSRRYTDGDWMALCESLGELAADELGITDAMARKRTVKGIGGMLYSRVSGWLIEGKDDDWILVELSRGD